MSFCLILIPGIAVTRYLPDWVISAILAVVALLAAVGPRGAFSKFGPASTTCTVDRQLSVGTLGEPARLPGRALVATAEILKPNRNARLSHSG